VAIIESRSLTKRFSERTAVENLDLSVKEGETLGFLGPNGAGKTTTIRMLAGMVAPTSGYVEVAGLRPDRQPEQLHETVGLLTESPGFYERLTAARNLEYFAGFYSGRDARANIPKYLRQMGLWERRDDRVGTFSKGMKQKLALVRTLMHEPRVLFLDEPTAGLDPAAARDVREIIQGLSQEGRTIFLSTHNLAEAELLCRRIAVIRTQLLALDTPENLRQRLFRQRVAVRLEAVETAVVEAVEKLPFVQKLTGEGNQLMVELTDSEKNIPDLVKCIVDAGGRVMAVSEERYSLEDVYLTLISEEADHGT